MMNRLFTLSRFWFVFVAVLAAGALFNACSDDPVAPPAPTGTSVVTVMHANAGFTPQVVFKRDTVALATLAYGGTQKVTLPNGNQTVAIRATDGSQLTSAGISLDTTKSTWVFFSGNATTRESFSITANKIVPSTGTAAVRVVNASNNVGDVSIHLNSTAGPAFTQTNVAYKSGTPFVELPVSTTVSLVVNKPDNSGMILTVATGAGVLTAGKRYTVVIYGSSDPNADPSVRLTSVIVED